MSDPGAGMAVYLLVGSIGLFLLGVAAWVVEGWRRDRGGDRE